MAAIRLRGVSFAHSDAAPLFNDLELHLASPGWVGIVGANGAGKTTLLHLIAGTLRPQSGAVHLDPRDARVVLCPQTVEHLTPDVAALEHASDGAARRWLGRLALDPAWLARWPTLSPGERKRFQLAAALADEPDVLLLDEPTNHLDVVARERVLAALAQYRGLGLVVSHDRALLAELTGATLRVDRGEARLFHGAYDAARSEWEAEEQGEREAYARLRSAQKQAAQRLDGARREHAAAEHQRSGRARMKGPRDHDATGMLQQGRVEAAAKSLAKRVDVARAQLARIETRVADARLEKRPGGAVFVDYVRAPSRWLAVLDQPRVCAGEGGGAVEVLRDVRLDLGREDRVWVAGPNGAGKSTLLGAVLAAARLPEERVMYVPQEIGEARAAELLDEVRALPAKERGRVLALVAALGTDPEPLLRSASPSPGEARKLMIAAGLGRHVWALVLDEPTNHLDLPSLERLENALVDYPGALLLVSHDERFARACTTTRWRVERGTVRVDG